MVEFDLETTGLQAWSQKQFAFLYIFLDGDAQARLLTAQEAQDRIQTCELEGIEPLPEDTELAEVALPGDEVWGKAEAIPHAPDADSYVNLGYLQDDPVVAKAAGVANALTEEQRARNAARIQAWFDHCIEDPDGIRAWNSNFDRSFGDIAGFVMPGDDRWHDGMLDAQAIDERRSVALKAVAGNLFGDEATDPQKAVKAWLTEERKRRAKESKENETELVEPDYSDVPAKLMETYALDDVILTRKVCDRYDPILADNPDLRKVSEFERGVMDALFHVQKRGLPTSEQDYRKLEQEVVGNLDGLESKCYELAAEANEGKGVPDFNPKSSPKIIEALQGRGANLDFMEKEGGKIKSADAQNLRAVDDELALAILKFRSEFKVLSTYVRPMIGRSYVTSMRMYKEPFIAPDGRVHASYRQVGARTGRMSCSDPNMQNQPRDDLRLRYCIKAEEGHKLIAVDLSNIEMVLFAAYAGQGKLLDAVQRGEDLHTLTAKMLGLTDRMRADGNVETARQLGKTYNFSRVYGGGLRTIKKSFRCNMDEARRLKKLFDNAYPEVRNLSNRIEYRLEDQGFISDKLISGRRFRVAQRDAFKATNYLVQGTAAALFKKSLMAMHEENIPVVALIHDEVVAHVPAEQAVEVQARLIHHLTNHPTLQEVVPLKAEGDICDHWSDAKPFKDGTLFVPNWAQGGNND